MVKRKDKYGLYQRSVQKADSDARLLSRRFYHLTGRPLRLLREDFCGSAQLLCEFVRLHSDNHGIGYDLESACLEWCRKHNFTSLTAEQRKRIRLFKRNVLSANSHSMDLVAALNFSYSVFRTRKDLLQYFQKVRRSLQRDGLFVLDAQGGSEVPVEGSDEWEVGDFRYVWEVTSFDPITHHMQCKIHFLFPDGSRIRNAFVYNWRLWTLPEIREALAEAGFRKIEVWWEGTDRKTSLGNGIMRRVKRGRPEGAWYAMIAASK